MAPDTDTDPSMSGKLCLVTGATAGIGLVTARALAQRGATVCIVGRSRERSEAAVRQIQDRTGNQAVEFLLGDLSSQSDIRQLAQEFRGRHSRLDVLVNNAGGMFLNRQESADGIEMTLALNHLAYFLLTNLLLDLLKSSTPARVVSVASDAHRFAPRIDFDDLQHRKSYRGFRVYAESKLANVLFSGALARRLAGTGVTSNALHPGFIASNFFAAPGMKPLLGRLMALSARFFAISPEEGAKTSIHLAASPEVEGVTGKYFEKQKPVIPSRAAQDETTARRLWEVSDELTRQASRV
jgi:NAD(P)-dependent dehydrogenase (short-subunit alcohol dehydrogenase family)